MIDISKTKIKEMPSNHACCTNLVATWSITTGVVVDNYPTAERHREVLDNAAGNLRRLIWHHAYGDLKAPIIELFRLLEKERVDPMVDLRLRQIYQLIEYPNDGDKAVPAPPK